MNPQRNREQYQLRQQGQGQQQQTSPQRQQQQANWADDGEDAEVRGILLAGRQGDFESRFGSFVISDEGVHHHTGSSGFGSFGNNGDLSTWGRGKKTPGPSGTGPSPPNAFRFGLSFSDFSDSQQSGVQQQLDPQWYENLPQGAVDMSPNGVPPLDFEFLSGEDNLAEPPGYSRYVTHPSSLGQEPSPNSIGGMASAANAQPFIPQSMQMPYQYQQTPLYPPPNHPPPGLSPQSRQQFLSPHQPPQGPSMFEMGYQTHPAGGFQAHQNHPSTVNPSMRQQTQYPPQISQQQQSSSTIPPHLQQTRLQHQPIMPSSNQIQTPQPQIAPQRFGITQDPAQQPNVQQHPHQQRSPPGPQPQQYHQQVFPLELEEAAQQQPGRYPKRAGRGGKQQSSPRQREIRPQIIDMGQQINLDDDGNDPASKKRQELVESPTTRLKFKEFYRQFRAYEKESFEQAHKYAEECLKSDMLPTNIHWRVYLELADLAKRENRFTEARRLYRTVNKLQPYAPQGWLEYSKMEEECGRLHHCQQILHEGLNYCGYSESLLTKAIKHEERMGNLGGARALLGRLRTQTVDKQWRTILEGALLEARHGNVVIARKVFKYLMQHVPWYGPIFFEAARFEEKNEEFGRAIEIVEKGLAEIPRYGPLWFNAFRLHEKIETIEATKEMLRTGTNICKVKLLSTGDDILRHRFGLKGDEFEDVPASCELLNTRGCLQRSMNCISKELIWKVHFEVAQVSERGGSKGWLERARYSYVQSVLRCPPNLRWKIWLAGARTELEVNLEKAHQLVQRALNDVPEKSKAQVLLEMARLEEFNHDIDKAREILKLARAETSHEWKVFLESVMLEVRGGCVETAIEMANESLKTHAGTGRLWAILVQLKHFHGPDAQRLVFREALKNVPKSGEVWAEGARLHMNPLSPHYDLNTAERYLEFAIQFTPQYGDSFIEALKFRLLRCDVDPDWSDEEYSQAMRNCDTSDLDQKCLNADPNYGALWFHCKRGPFDTARQVLRTAKKLLIQELTKFRSVYINANEYAKQKKLENQRKNKENANNNAEKVRTTPALAHAENRWLIEHLENLDQANEDLDFSTALVHANWIRERVDMLTDSERRKILFGSDQIVP